MCNWKLFFLFLNQNICCGYSKELSQWDGSFEHLKHMFKLMDKKIITILRILFLLNWPYDWNLKISNSFIASGDFYCLRITFANSLDPNQDRQNVGPGPKVIKLFSCSTQLSMKFILLIDVKMPTIVGILTFISMINTTSERARNFFICRYFNFYD